MRRSPQHLNLYGDIGRHPTEGFGIDISAERLDWLDLECLQYVNEHSHERLRGLDLGCGLGRPSIAFSITGADMHLIDIEDMSLHFETLSVEIPLYGLEFTCHDLRVIGPDKFWQNYSFCYSQRTIHYLTFHEAVNLASFLASRMSPGSPFWLSASGLGSKLGLRYEGAGQPIESRFGYLAPEMAKKHRINAPICLYTEKDLACLGESSGFTVAKIRTSAFGNVKGIFKR